MVEEFVYLGSLVHSSTQNAPDISRCNAITRAAMQNLEKQIWRSRITIPTKLKLYNTCILPIFLYGSECWAVTKRNVLKINALDQWCLRKLLGIKWYHHVRNVSEIFLRQLFRRRLLASGQDRRHTLHTCYFWQAASAGVHSTVPAHSKCAYAA